MPARYARVIVDVAPAHLDRPFDYLIPDGAQAGLGSRVQVVFNGRRRTGWVIDTGHDTDANPAKIRALRAVQGDRAWFDQGDLELFAWIARRYAAPLADVLRHALPPRVAAVEQEAAAWAAPEAHTARAERAELGLATGLPHDRWAAYDADRLRHAVTAPTGEAFWLATLPGDDIALLVADLVAACVADDRAALIIVGDPASPVPDAATAVWAGRAVDFRRVSSRARSRAFWRCRTGHARIAVGERSAVFAPLQRLGLVVVIDEASPAHKEQRSPRHHARDVGLARARMAGATAVVCSDLPSAALWRLLSAGHVHAVTPDRAAVRSRAPRVEVVDLSDPRPGTRRARFSTRAAGALSDVVAADGAAVVLTALAGQGAALACRACGTRRECPVCTSAVRDTRGDRRVDCDQWECPTCAWTGGPWACARCGDARTAPLAAGAARLAAELTRSYPGAQVSAMEGFDAPGPTRRPAIAVMTRGSAVARPAWLGDQQVGAVILPDADALLYRGSLDAAEDALRLWFGVARWVVAVGHDSAAGCIVVQTREPGHPAVQALVRWDPTGFWRGEAPRRAELSYPPARSLIRLVATIASAPKVAQSVRDAVPAGDEVLGPDPAGALLLKSARLPVTIAALDGLRRGWSKSGVSVHIDVDPVDNI